LGTAGDGEIQRIEEYPIGTHAIPCHRMQNPDGATAGPFGVLPPAKKRGGGGSLRAPPLQNKGHAFSFAQLSHLS